MRAIVFLSLRFRYLVIAGAVALMFFGVQTLGHQKVDVFPEFAPVTVEIQTETLGLSPSEVESLVTVPLENALQGVPRVTDVESESVPQLSAIFLYFKHGTDVLQARQLVQERLAAAAPSLPSWAAPPALYPIVSATSRVMQVGITSNTVNNLDLSKLAFYTIRPRLLHVPGVANVAMWGETKKEIQVHADPARLNRQKVPLGALTSRRRQRRRQRPVVVHDRRLDRLGRVRRDPESAARDPQRPGDQDAAAAGQRAGRPARFADADDRRPRARALRRAAADRDGGRQRRPGADARDREVPGRQHDRRHQRDPEGVQGAAAGLAGDPRQHAHLPPGELHPHGDPQPVIRGPARLHPGRVRADRVPVPVARGVRQPARDPAVARRGGDRAGRRGHDHQHDDSCRLRGRGRRRRRRRDHRHGEHRAAPAQLARRRQAHDAAAPLAGGVARGPHRDPLRDADQHRRGAAGRVRRRADGVVLPTARGRLRARRARVDGGRADGHAGAGDGADAQRAPGARGSAADRLVQARLPQVAGPGHPPADCGDPHGDRGDRRRSAGAAEPRAGPVPDVQGAGSPDALRQQAGHLFARDETRGQQARAEAARDPRPSGHSGRSAHRPGAARRGDRRARVLRAVDHAVPARQRRSRRRPGQGGSRIVPRDVRRPHHVSARADRRDDHQPDRGPRRPNRGAGLPHAAAPLPAGNRQAQRHAAPGRPAPTVTGLRSPDPGDRRCRRRGALRTDARAPFAARRRSSSAARRSASCGSAGQRSACRAGASRRCGATSATSRTC